MIAIILLFLLLQTDSSIFIEPDSPLTIRLNGGETILAYNSLGDEVVTITAHALGELDPVLEILTPDMHRLAYNDDHHTTSETLSHFDSVLERIPLAESGTYIIRLDSFNGVSEGDVEVTLETVEPLQATVEETEAGVKITVELTPDSVYSYQLSLKAGEKVTITARDPQSVLDPVLTLLDTSGLERARNDDHRSEDLTLNIFDSRLETPEIDVDTDFRIELREFTGRAGIFEISIDHVSD